MQTFITPPEAISVGAQWRISGGSWQNAETTLILPVTSQINVQFQPLTQWAEPNPMPISLLADKPTTITASYTPLPVYAIGQIPPQSIWHGQSARFLVTAPPPFTHFEMLADAAPFGELSFDSFTQRVTYTPAPADKWKFNVTFRATGGGQTVSQVVAFYPMPHLLPEQSILEYKRPIPDPESKDYLFISESVNPNAEPFNNTDRNTRTVNISGKSILFDAETQKNGLYQSYHGNDDIKEMNLYAETVTIRDPLHLPQTNVTIYARELRFEDKPDPAPKARLITTPRSLTTRPSMTVAGKPGLKAGDIHLYIGSFYSSDNEILRLNLTGGNGQPGAFGKDGAIATSMPSMSVPLYPSGTRDKVVCIYIGSSLIWGNASWPGDGKNATPPTKPGNGGQGGDIGSTLDLSAQINQSGGQGGEKALDVKGSAAGTPNPAYWVILATAMPERYSITATHTQYNGANAAAPATDVPIGPSGKKTAIPQKNSWLHPLTMRSLLLHARDAYLNGNLDYVSTTLNEYIQLNDRYQQTEEYRTLDEAQRLELEQIRGEMATLLHRVANNLDYFGNPAGWTPMLSFEANLTAFQNEIDPAIRILYLSYWLTKVKGRVNAQLAAVGNARDKLGEEIEANIQRYNTTQGLIPFLQTEAGNIQAKIEEIALELEQIERVLMQRAQHNVRERNKVPFWKKCCQVGSIICKAVPVYQPVLGMVGGGLDVVSNLDTSNPKPTLDQLQSLSKEFTDAKFQESAQNWKTEIDKIELKNVKDYKTYVKNLQAFGKPLLEGLKQVQDVLKDTEIPQNEVDAELLKLKAADPEFNKVVADLQDLNGRKMLFAERIAAAMQSIGALADGITKDLLAVDNLNRDLSGTYGQIDHAAFMYIKEMEQRTKDRLLKYQYYMAKAYEYRMLKPYQGNLNLNRIFERFVTLVENPNSSHILTQDQFDTIKSVYIEELRNITAQIYDELNTNAPEQSIPIRFSLTPDELTRLNRDGQVVVNLYERGIFGGSEENIRIVDFDIYNLAVADSNTGFGGSATLDLTCEHTGVSKLQSKGKFYLFRHYRNETVNPITWKFRYDPIDEVLDKSKPSAAAQSLIRHLLNLENHQDADVMLYSRPSAWADILIKKETRTSDHSDINVTNLRFSLQYDYFTRQSNQAELRVVVDGGYTPYIFIDRVDLNQRQDGRGEFRRTYPLGQRVNLRAQEDFGYMIFDHWEDDRGVVLSKSSTCVVKLDQPIKKGVGLDNMEVALSGNKLIRAVYRPIPVENWAIDWNFYE